MFNKPTCSKCKKLIKSDFEFCPYCGTSQNSNNEWGMLGKTDGSEAPKQEDPFSQLLPSGLTGGILNKMLGNAMKMVENEIQKGMQQPNNPKNINLKPNQKLQLFVNGKKITLTPKTAESTKKQAKAPVKQVKKSLSKDFTDKIKEKFNSLPKEEPKTNIRRLSNKIIYELEMPGVKKLENISIRNLEKSIEIKAISKDKAYYKIIVMDLPLVKYSIEKETLILELETKD